MTDQDRQDEYVGSKWFFIIMLVIVFSFAFIGIANSQENGMVEGERYTITGMLLCDTPDQVRQALTLYKYEETLSVVITIVNEFAQTRVCGTLYGEIIHKGFFSKESIKGFSFQIMEVTLTHVLSIKNGMIPIPSLKVYGFWELIKTKGT